MKKMIFVFAFIGLLVLSACSSYDMGYYEPNYAYEKVEGIEGETYAEIIENEFISTSDMPVSTFSTDVDTAAYSNIRRIINDGFLPDSNVVRIEEMVNYFSYDFAGPQDDEVVSIYQELSLAPWNEDHQLFMIGLKAEEIQFEDSEGMNLVFLIDVSGSMSSNDKLPLLKSAMKLLVEQLRPTDRISIVVYAGAAGVVLEGGDSANKAEIYSALNKLQAGGSTAGGAGIKLAYQVAERNYIEGGMNRIIIASDGDFNVGMSSTDELQELVEEKRESGVFLSVLGFGTGNFRNDMMETIANHGNGVYYYIDSILEAEKVFVHQLGASMITVAKDVKLQIEFNPVHVKGYRLIGYENRMLTNQDFENDTKDAGDMGSGHVVVAFYEIIPAGSDEIIESNPSELPDDLRYGEGNRINEYVNVSIRYKDPLEDSSLLIQKQGFIASYTETPSESFRFASSVVEFGLILRNSTYKYNSNYDALLSRANNALGDDPFGYRDEFIDLVQKAMSLAD